jgi:hypothetical protein
MGVPRLFLQQHGFLVGAHIVEKSSGKLFVIKEITTEGNLNVNLVNVNERAPKKQKTCDADESEQVKFTKTIKFRTISESADYKTTKVDIEWSDGKSLVGTELYEVMKGRSIVSLALASLSSSSADAYNIRNKPKGVIASTSAKKSDIVFVPHTLNIKAADGSPPTNCYEVHVGMGLPSFYLASYSSKTVSEPFWVVKSVDEAKDANMILKSKKVSIEFGNTKVEVEIPIMTNSASLKAGAELCIHVAKERKDDNNARTWPIFASDSRSSKEPQVK